MISTVVWDTLTPQQQQWLQEAASESVPYQKQAWETSVQEALEAVKAAGVVVSEPDTAPFQEKVQSLYEEFRAVPEVFDLIQRIKAVQ